MKETRHEYLRRKLRETVGLHSRIAKQAGLAQTTVSRIHNGAIPRLDVAEKLIAYFEQYDLLAKCGGRLRRTAAPLRQHAEQQDDQ